MQVQKIEKGTILGEISEKITTVTIKEITPFGIRMEGNAVEEFAGVYNASGYSSGTMLLKTDGTVDWEIKLIQLTNEGDLIIGNGYGTGRMTGPKTSVGEGEVVFMTQSQKLSWLNNKKCKVETTSNMATGEEHAKVYAL